MFHISVCVINIWDTPMDVYLDLTGKELHASGTLRPMLISAWLLLGPSCKTCIEERRQTNHIHTNKKIYNTLEGVNNLLITTPIIASKTVLIFSNDARTKMIEKIFCGWNLLCN